MEGKDHELGLECVRAYNDWMIEDWCGESGGRLIPLCIIPMWEVELAVAEVTRNAARGARAVCFSEIPPHLGLPSIHTGYWDPLFAVCEETRTVLCMHIGSSSKMPAASPDAPPSTAIMLSFNNSMASLADFLFSGVLVRFPELKLAYSEGQIGWIPYALERADNTWEYHSNWTRAKETIPDPPSTYYRGRIFGCFTNDMHGVASIAAVGEDNICFETDYPHTDTTWPFTHEEVERMTAALSDEQRYKVLRGNAIRMLDLDRV
jgi:predicted TIM-barrel fold metal-dependent hydrolase